MSKKQMRITSSEEKFIREVMRNKQLVLNLVMALKSLHKDDTLFSPGFDAQSIIDILMDDD